MELTVFNKQNSGFLKKSTPKLGIGKNGMFRIGLAAGDLLGLKEGGGVSLAKDADDNWYIFKDAEGFTLRTDSGGALTFNSSSVARQIGRTGTFLIGGVPTKVGKVQYWGILIPND
jgi:hypothetical protein